MASGGLSRQLADAIALAQRLQAEKAAQALGQDRLSLDRDRLALARDKFSRRKTEFDRGFPLREQQTATGQFGAETARMNALRRIAGDAFERSPEAIRQRAMRKRVDVSRDPAEAARMGGLGEDAVTESLREAGRERRRAARREGAKSRARERARGQTKLGTKMVERALGMGPQTTGQRADLEQQRQANRIEMARIRGLIKNALDQTGMGLPPEEAQRIIDQIAPQESAPGEASLRRSASASPGAGSTIDPETGERLIERIGELRAQGLGQDEAEQQALAEFGLE